MKKTQAELARQFLELHRGPRILVLPNAWDVSSARIFEDAGFPAIGTTSAGVAFSLGYPDGQKIPRGEMLAVVRRIAEAVEVPVTADVEAGFGSTPEEVADTAREVIAAGAVGIFIADAGVYFVKAFGPSNIPRLREVTLDLPVFAFALGVSLATGVLFGLAPAIGATRHNLVESLKEGGRTAAPGRVRAEGGEDGGVSDTPAPET